MADVEDTVHVGVCHGAHELGIFLAELSSCYRVVWHVLERGGILLEDLVLLPFLLVFLFNSNECVSFFGLLNYENSSDTFLSISTTHILNLKSGSLGVC